MKRKVEDWSVAQLYKERTRISFPEYQREKMLWPEEKKSLLIDSILQDIDIPKLYFNRLKDKNLEVIDGQQRLWSIWQYLDGMYRYKVNGTGQLFSNLSFSQKKQIENYKFQITVFDEATDDYLRTLFVRLQLGLLLNTGEKLNVATGKMKEFVFKKLVAHSFIKRLGIPARRYAKQTLCAQICINSFTRQKLKSFARTRYDDLLNFFSEYEDPRGQDLVLFNSETRKIEAVLDELRQCFGAESEKLKNRSYILSIYLFIEELSPLSTRERKTFVDFVFRLWKRLREEMKLGMDRTNRELYSFESFLSSAPGEAYQIERRHEKLKEYYTHFKETGKIKGDK
jgi:hypothetical protein